MLENFILLAEYNAEMNVRGFIAAKQLSNAELLKERGAFFGSILGTMNHLIVADTIWLQRIANHPAQFSSLVGLNALGKPASLDQLLFTDLDQLVERRSMLDQIIKDLMLEMNTLQLNSMLFYTRTDGTAAHKRLNDVLLHFFNHQTHHRGQISTLLFQSGIDVGVTDLLTLVPDPVAN